MKAPQSVSEVLTALGYGAFVTAAVVVPGCIGCVGNPAPTPVDASTDAASAPPDTDESDSGNR